MIPHAVAVKGFIIHDGKILILKRSPDDVHKPGVWDIPGGRVEEGESPFEGVHREVREETGLEIEIVAPLRIHYFKRDDGQQITMIVFMCTTPGGEVVLDHENSAFEWVTSAEAREYFQEYYHGDLDNYERFFQKAI